MLYQIYEAHRSLMEPFADFAMAASKLYSNPCPLRPAPFAQRISAGYDLIYRLGKDYTRSRSSASRPSARMASRSPSRNASCWTSPSASCAAFKRFSDDPRTLETLHGQPAVLIVAPLSGHYATLLRDTVRLHAARPQGVHHRLAQRPHGALGGR
jgi:poly(3-hydroxybutyrate) depolymerase